MKQAGCGQRGDAAIFYAAAVLTVSDKGSRGEREDTSGPALQEMLVAEGFQVVAAAVVPDDVERIRECLLDYVDTRAIDLIVTTGGTGVAPSDLTPEAVMPLLERTLPGFSELMRMKSFEKTPRSLLSRAVCGVRRQSLIVTLPGSERGARENLAWIMPALGHTLDKIKGVGGDCGS